MMHGSAKSPSIKLSHRSHEMKDPKNFENHIKNVLDKHKERNGEGNNVSAENLFLVGKNGAMGQFSNGAAKEEASRRIRESLFTELGIKTP